MRPPRPSEHPTAPRARIGFLFNHDQPHQVAHSLPIALALHRRHPELEVVLASTHPRVSAEIRRLGGDAADAPVLTQLGLSTPASRWAEAAFGRLIPARKLLVYGDNLAFFRTLDVVVVAEKTSLALKRRYGLHHLRVVHTRHGAGDRAIGFDAASSRFDAVLVSGRKIRDRLTAEAGVDPDRLHVVGYPKFDVARAASSARLLPPVRPTVLYNPHSSPRLSSWFRWGGEVLNRLTASGRFNLIFAPHVMLFERPLAISLSPPGIALPRRQLRGLASSARLHIDLGSPASVDMSYTNAADIYLGDVSSQVYEFLRRPRPCVFLNPHRIRWSGSPNYAHWRAGPVVEDLDQLEAAIDEAVARHETHFAPIQRELFAYTFDLTDRPSSERAADAVASLVGSPQRAHA